MNMASQNSSDRLTALLRTLDPGIDARSPLTAAQVATVQGWRVRQGDGAAAAVARAEERRLASAVFALGAGLACPAGLGTAGDGDSDGPELGDGDGHRANPADREGSDVSPTGTGVNAVTCQGSLGGAVLWTF